MHPRFGYVQNDGLDLHHKKLCVLSLKNRLALLYPDEMPEKPSTSFLGEKFAPRKCCLCKEIITMLTEHYEDDLYSFTFCKQEGNNHRFHRRCLKGYLLDATKKDILNVEKYKIRCPYATCKCAVTLQDVKIITGLKKYRQEKLKTFYKLFATVEENE